MRTDPDLPAPAARRGGDGTQQRLERLLGAVAEGSGPDAVRDSGRTDRERDDPGRDDPDRDDLERDDGGPTGPEPQRRATGRHRGHDAEERPPLLTLPVALRGADLSVRPSAVLGMLLVVLLVAGVLGVRVWVADRRSQPVPVASALAGAEAGAPGAPDGHPAELPGPQGHAASPSGPPGVAAGPAVAPTVQETSAAVPVVVHVAGQVQRPGVVRLSPGARIQDALSAAGGLTDGADLSRLNLARIVTDGERVYVPAPGEEAPEVDGPGAGPPPGPDGAGPGGQQVSLNSADPATLETLPGVGPVTAGRIVAWREEHGPFRAVEELLEVSGIGERTLETLRAHVTL